MKSAILAATAVSVAMPAFAQTPATAPVPVAAPAEPVSPSVAPVVAPAAVDAGIADAAHRTLHEQHGLGLLHVTPGHALNGRGIVGLGVRIQSHPLPPTRSNRKAQ